MDAMVCAVAYTLLPIWGQIMLLP